MTSITFFTLVALAILATESAGQNQCHRDEVMAPCGKECEDRCNAVRPEHCREMRCSHSDCRCKDGLVRNPYTNSCIRKASCAFDGCGYGERKFSCGRTCEGTCSNPLQPTECEGMFCPKRECRCELEAGFVRNERTGFCVRKELC